MQRKLEEALESGNCANCNGSEGGIVLEDLKSYRIAKQLRGIASRYPEEANGLIHAAEWLENEANDMLKLCGSVTHNEIRGRITMGCVTTNTELSGALKINRNQKPLFRRSG